MKNSKVHNLYPKRATFQERVKMKAGEYRLIILWALIGAIALIALAYIQTVAQVNFIIAYGGG